MRRLLSGGVMLIALLQPAALHAQTAVSPDAVTAFLDSTVTAARKRFGIPGMAVIAVQRGQIIAERAWGFADLAVKKPMSTTESAFTTGSVSKTITAAAILKAVRNGRLKLNDRLTGLIPGLGIDGFADEITLEHLLTHTAGFELRNLGLVAADADAMLPYRQWLGRGLPRRIARAGEEFIYSQEGMSLAALMLEEASGVAFEAYARDSILRPLGMMNATMEIDGYRSPRLVTAYFYRQGADSVITSPVIHGNLTPAGGLIATTSEMGQLLLALLGHRPAVIPPEVLAQMHRTWFRPESKMRGIGMGLYDYPINDRSGKAHGGWYGGTSTFLYILPEEDFGIYLAGNVDNGDLWRHTFLEALHDRFFPRHGDVAPMPSSFAAGIRPELYTGYYRRREFAATGLERLGHLFLADVGHVRRDADGNLVIRRSEGTMRAVGVSPTSFRIDWRGDEDYIGFDATSTSPPRRLFINMDIYDRIPAWQARPRLLYVLGAAVGSATLGLVLVAALVITGARGTRLASSVLTAAIGTALSAIAGFVYLFRVTPVEQFALGVPPLVRVSAATAFMGLALLAIAAALEGRVWNVRGRRQRLIIGYSFLSALMAVGVCLFTGILSTSALTAEVGPSRVDPLMVARPKVETE
ncbi:MAG: serine hydrolase domain-containing protein [Gemmatimonadota bacterium]